jgi:protease I
MRIVTMKALIISADSFEDTELLFPFYRLREEGFGVEIASVEKARIRGKHGYEVDASLNLREVNPGNYSLLLLPGGRAPERLRREGEALNIARYFFREEKPVSAICHGPQILVSAGLLKGRRATCYRSVAGELRDAGALYEDSEVVVDGNLVTSRQPGDLPAFMRETMKKIR